MSNITVWIYMLQCADGSYYIGKYQGEMLETRLWEHNNGKHPDAIPPSGCQWRLSGPNGLRAMMMRLLVNAS